MDKAEMDRKTERQDKENAAAGHSSRFYQNRQCEYFPCHDMESEVLNCLFCYCPLYHGRCPGEAHAIKMGNKEFKDCSRCEFPHRPENYDTILERIMAMLQVRS